MAPARPATRHLSPPRRRVRPALPAAYRCSCSRHGQSHSTRALHHVAGQQCVQHPRAVASPRLAAGGLDPYSSLFLPPRHGKRSVRLL
eukprot:scaffold1789_cov375-Prasinococcus_capsulatus_cf.AAC.10